MSVQSVLGESNLAFPDMMQRAVLSISTSVEFIRLVQVSCQEMIRAKSASARLFSRAHLANVPTCESEAEVSAVSLTANFPIDPTSCVLAE